MNSYFKLRHQFAREYPEASNWRAAALDIGLNPSAIVLQGTSIAAWSNIFEKICQKSAKHMLGDFVYAIRHRSLAVRNGHELAGDLP